MVLRDFVSRAEPTASTTTSSKRSISPGRPSKAASAPIGAFSTRRGSRNSHGPGRSPIPITGKLAGHRAAASACCCRCRSWRSARVTLAQAVMLAGCCECRRRLVRASSFAFWNGHYFVPGAAFALGLGIVLLVPLIVIALARIEEIAADRLRPQAAPARRAPRRSCRKLLRAESLDPHPGLSRAAGDAEADARCRRAARLSEFRMRGRHQQHARSGSLAADRGALPHARRALQVRQRRQLAGLQGRRAAACDGPHRRRRRDHRRHRRRLCRASGLAEGPGAAVRRSDASAWCRRRRITATANAASCITP